MEHLRGPLHKFAMAIFSGIRKQNPEGNMLFSPMTASAGLLILMSASSGTTKQEMEELMYLNEQPQFQTVNAEHDIQMAFRRVLSTLSSRSSLRSSVTNTEDENQAGEGPNDLFVEDYGLFEVFRLNKLYVQSGIPLANEFVETLAKLKAEYDLVDFISNPNAVRQQINKEIRERVNQKLGECFIMGSITKSTRLVLGNGICFRARWQNLFDIEETTMLPFKPLKGKPIEVPTMNGTFQVPYLEDAELDAVYIELPYLRGAASFIILSPKKPKGLVELEKNLKPGVLSRLNLSKRMKDITISLPKFEIKVNFDMKEVLVNAGTKAIFSEQADLSRMTPHRICVSAACHCGYFRIDEKGTDVDSASTETPPEEEQSQRHLAFRRSVSTLSGTHLEMSSAVKQGQQVARRVKVEVDHPFLFAVRHNKSGLMLCLGRVETIS